MVEETTAASRVLAEQTGELARLTEHFRLGQVNEAQAKRQKMRRSA